MSEFMSFFNVVLGLITVVLSVYVAFSFSLKGKQLRGDSFRLSYALSFQLMGEAVMGLGTLVFALAQLSGQLQNWPETIQSTLRFAMFIATSATTIHLTRTINQIDGSD